MPDELDFEAAVPPESPTPATGSVEYPAPNGEKWRIERGGDLMADFEIGPSRTGDSLETLTKFHSALGNQEPAWNIICRLYGNAPLYGVDDLDEMRVWTIAELAEKRGVEPRDLDAFVEGAKTFWKRAQLETQSVENVRVRPAVDEETADLLLREHGFGDVENPEERKYIASRCQELQLWLDNDQLRAATRSMLQQEITLFFILDPTIRGVRSEIARKLTEHHGVEKENTQLLSLMKERRDAQGALDNSMKVLGLFDSAGGALRKKMQFNDTLSILIEAIQKYYSEDDRELIDGLFTAAEVELLMTPTELRPMQYRPDLVLMALEAKEHLWEADYSPTKLGRRASRKLTAGFAQGLAEARSQEGEVTNEEAAAEELEEAEVQQSSGNPAGPMELPEGGGVHGVPALPVRSGEEAAAMF